MARSISYGVKWNGIGQIFTQTTVIIGSLLLSRILTPQDFGTVAMVTIIYSYAATFLDMGFSHALIQKKTITQNELSSVFWLNNLIGFFFFLVFFIGASWIATFYKEPSLITLTRAISLTFLLAALPQIPRVLLTRNLEFKKINLVNILSVPISYLMAIIMGYLGFGVWSIIGQILISNVLVVVIYWSFVRWSPKIRLRQKDLGSIIKFSFNTFLYQLIDHWSQNINGLLIGRNIGATEMGLYNRSRVFLTLPIRNFSAVLTNSTFPKLAQIQGDDAQVKSIYLKSVHFLSFWIIPALFGLSFVAEEFVLFFLGTQWIEMVPILQIFAFISIFTSIFYIGDSAISSQGRIDLLVRLSFFEKGILIVGSFIGIQFGLMGVVYANFIGILLVTAPKYLLLNKVIRTRLADHLRIHLPIILKSAFMLTVLYLVKSTLNITDAGLMLFILVIAGIATYVAVNLAFTDPIFKESMIRVKKLIGY